MESKELWRAYAREKFSGEKVAHSQFVDGIVEFLTENCPRGLIVSYDAMNDEVDLGSLIDQVDPARLCLTRTPEADMHLTVHRFEQSTLERHKYGFMQPTASSPQIRDSDVVAVLVPGLLFDQFGTRLGHGQGYYDRFLSRLNQSTKIVGITKDIVLAEKLPSERHDVQMTHLATSNGVKPVHACP